MGFRSFHHVYLRSSRFLGSQSGVYVRDITMITIRLFGDRDDNGKLVWSIKATDTRGQNLETSGVADTEDDAKGEIGVRLMSLITALKFVRVQEE